MKSEIIDSIRQSLDIAQVIGEVVPLKKKGANYFGLCPFHSEKSGSFSVSPMKQLFYCFGCHVGGDVFKFVQLYFRWDFQQSLEELGRRAGIKVDSFHSDPSWDEGLKILELVADSFEEQLHSKDGQDFRDYLKHRKIPAKIVEAFRLGAHLGASDAISKRLQKEGLSRDLATQLGVLGRSQGGDFYDRFRGRLMFPIMDEKGRPRGFGGRSLGSEEPKYLNSPKSLLFDKSRLLYGMHLAPPTVAKKGYSVLVEGYLDVMALHEFGVTNALGAMGTSLTSEQIRLLKKWSNRVISLYDADNAGVLATERNLGNLLREGLEAKVVILPIGKDPDAFLHQDHEKPEELKKGLKAAFEASVSAVDYLVQKNVLSEKEPVQRARKFSELVKMLDQMPDEIERTLYKKELAKRFDLSESLLLKASKADARPVEPFRPAFKAAKGSEGRWEREMLKYWIQYADRAQGALTDVVPYLSLKNIWGQLLSKLSQNGLEARQLSRLEWLNLEDPEMQDPLVRDAVHQWAMEDLPEGSGVDLTRVWNDLLRGLRKEFYKDFSQRIQQELMEAEKSQNMVRVQELLAQKRDLARVIKAASDEGAVDSINS